MFDPNREAVLKKDETAPEGLCLHEAVQSDYVCGWLRRDIKDTPAFRGLVASCDETRGNLTTDQDFGCIHHEEE